MHPVRQRFYSCGFSSNPLYPSDLFFHNHITVRQTPTVGPEEAVDSPVPPQTHRVSPAALTKELLQEFFFFFFSIFLLIQNSFGISDEQWDAPNTRDHFQTPSLCPLQFHCCLEEQQQWETRELLHQRSRQVDHSVRSFVYRTVASSCRFYSFIDATGISLKGLNLAHLMDAEMNSLSHSDGTVSK